MSSLSAGNRYSSSYHGCVSYCKCRKVTSNMDSGELLLLPAGSSVRLLLSGYHSVTMYYYIVMGVRELTLISFAHSSRSRVCVPCLLLQAW